MDSRPIEVRHGGRVIIALVSVLGLAIAAVALAGTVPVASKVSTAFADPVVAAAGDIACGADTPAGLPCMQSETSQLALQIKPNAVLPLGDEQYERGQLDNFRLFYDPSWGSLKSISHPAVGNHEYLTPSAGGYFDYFNGIGRFNGPAGRRDEGYYSFDLKGWHLIALNTSSDCQYVPCSAGSPQESWLKADLAAHPATCTLAYLHQPRWSSDDVFTQDTPQIQPLLEDLYSAGDDLLLAAHAHFYERFAPQNPSQQLDLTYGVRQIIVGTGGKEVHDPGTIEPNSEVRNGTTFGVLKITLHPTSYDWRFVPIDGQSFTDSGTTHCHGSPYPRPSGASPLYAPFVPAFQACDGGAPANATHAGPLSGASCNPPAPRSSFVAVGPQSLGFARLLVLGSGQCASFDSTHCYPDVTIRFNITDVRSGSPTGPDYDPSPPNRSDLTAMATIPGSARGEAIQITDQYSRLDTDPAETFARSATVVPLPFPIPMDCTATSSSSVGSTCNVQTTANTLVPGSAVAGKRAIWETGQLQILDRGPNGTPGDSDDQVLETQGVFVP